MYEEFVIYVNLGQTILMLSDGKSIAWGQLMIGNKTIWNL